MGPSPNLTNQIIFDLAGFSSFKVIGVAFFSNKAPPLLYFSADQSSPWVPWVTVY